jgi:hypothetical protein
MGAAETGWFRTESGTILEMDLPLPDGIAQRVTRGEIIRVANQQGAPWAEPGKTAVASSPDVVAELAAAQQQLAAARERVEELESEKVDLQARLVAATAELEQLTNPPDTPDPKLTPEPEPTPAAPARTTRRAANRR